MCILCLRRFFDIFVVDCSLNIVGCSSLQLVQWAFHFERENRALASMEFWLEALGVILAVSCLGVILASSYVDLGTFRQHVRTANLSRKHEWVMRKHDTCK